MNHRVRVRAKRRSEIDIDKLVCALLRLVQPEQVREPTEPAPRAPAPEGATPRSEESAA